MGKKRWAPGASALQNLLSMFFIVATQAFSPFSPPHWKAKRRLANRIERAAFTQGLNAQQRLLEYERERLKLAALNAWHDWYTSPFALSQSFRTQDFPQSDDRVLL